MFVTHHNTLIVINSILSPVVKISRDFNCKDIGGDGNVN